MSGFYRHISLPESIPKHDNKNIHSDTSSGRTLRNITESYQSRRLYFQRDAVDLTANSPGKPYLPSPSFRSSTTVIPRISGRSPALQTRREDHSRHSQCDRPPGAPHFVVGRNDSDFPHISFFPRDGRGAGVAMGLAFYQEGMMMKNCSIELCLPSFLRDARSLPFALQWPGYSHIQLQKRIDLIDPSTGNHVTYARIAQQASQIFSAFIYSFGDEFDGSPGGIQLGPRGLSFDNLRLHQVYIRDGRTMEAEVSYTRRY